MLKKPRVIKVVSLGVLLLIFTVSLKKSTYKIRTIAFYNVENLFDTENDPNTKDELSPIMELKMDKQQAYAKKIKNLGYVISQIGAKKSKRPPTVIGLAEVENRTVLEDLIASKHLKKYNYGIIHIDSPDERGIDVALIYQKAHFSPIEFQAFPLKIYNEEGYRIYTRDQLLVSGYLDGELIHFMVNHWPSRRGGVKRSKHKREKAALLAQTKVNSILQKDEKAQIIVMGDFNDNPTDKSLTKFLKGIEKEKLMTPDALYNPMLKLYKKGLNTIVYRGALYLFDQLLYSQALIQNKSKKKGAYFVLSTGIFNPPFLTTPSGRYKGYPFRSWGNDGFTGGYSDHYPIYLYLARKTN